MTVTDEEATVPDALLPLGENGACPNGQGEEVRVRSMILS
jgi:hypothetical protein